MRVVVGSRHKERSKGSSGPETCPVAQFLLEKFPRETINVGTSTLQVGRVKVNLPQKAKTWIKKWDELPKEDRVRRSGTVSFDIPDL